MKKWIYSLILTVITITTASCTDSHSQTSSPETKSLQTHQQEMITPTKVIQKNDIKPSLPKPIMPTQLNIPAIKVSAKIEPVALLPDGQMDVPKDSNIAGILYPGILPGAKGNVIIDGHVDSYIGPAIFFKLKKLNHGDEIIVSNSDGRKLTYIVESVESFTTAEAPLERIFGKSTEARMNLITCTGRYSRKKQEHEKRLIVFTKLKL
ncbi:class F sortase [Paenibacillus sp.]|uniref:class F sortase n=1 Tax=Paenibacillus sp. TaxID=58172 RepID=UPI0028AC1488|nr:class F sortase [Paenibacillus sp.]